MSQKKREVFEACDSFIKEGKTLSDITIENLGIRLRELGYLRGGNNTLSKYRREWIEQQGFREEDKDKNLLAIDVAAESFDRASERFRQSIQEEVRAEYEEKFQALVDKQANAERENTHLQATILELTDENTELKHQLRVTTDTLTTQTKALEASQTALMDVNARVEMQTEKLAMQEKHWQQKHDEMRETYQTELNTVHAELDKQRTHHSQALHLFKEAHEQQRHVWIKEQDDLKTDVKKLQKALAETKEQATVLKNDLHHQTTQYTDLDTQYAHYKVQAEAQLENQQERIANLMAENQQLKENQTNAEERYQATVTELQKTIHRLHDKMNQFFEHLETLTHDREKH